MVENKWESTDTILNSYDQMKSKEILLQMKALFF